MDQADAQALYGESYAALYNGLWEESPLWAPEARLHVEWVAKCIDPATRWLDVGCGTGWILSQFPEVERAGIDLSPAMLEHARSANPGASFREGDIRDDIPEWFNGWDLVSSTGHAWCYVDSIREIERIAENMARWTAPTGTLFVQAPDICDLTGLAIPYNFSGEAPANNSLAITAAVWSYYDEGGAHENMIWPSLDVWVRWISRWFHRIEVHTWPKEPEFLPVNRKIILAKGKRQPGEVSPTEVVLYPHPDEPPGTLPHAFDSAITPGPLAPTTAGAPVHTRLRSRIRRRAGAAKRRVSGSIGDRSSSTSPVVAANRTQPAVRPSETSSSAAEQITIRIGSLTFDAVARGPSGGEPVLLLHGFPESSWQWRFLQPSLAADGYRSVAPDLRGYSPGARPAGPANYSADALVADVIGFADGLGWDRFHLVGHDAGGSLAWHVAARHPERLRTLTVVSTPHPSAFVQALDALPRDDSDHQANLSAYMADLSRPGYEHVLVADGGAPLRERLLQSGMPPETADHYMGQIADPAALAGRLHWYQGFDWTDFGGFAPILTPTLYVWSTRDGAIGRTAAEATAQYVAGPYRFEVIDDVSHWIVEEVPQLFSRFLLDHLSS